MPNASNTERVVAAIGGEDVTASRAILAVQGPAAREHLATIAPEAAADRSVPGRARPRWRAPSAPSPAPATRARTASSWPCPPTRRPSVWEALLATGLLPAGLGARDTLRLEAALPLHGHELGPGHHPAAGRARLGRGVGQGGRLPRPRRAGRRAGAGRGPSPAGPARSRVVARPGPSRRCWSTARRRAWSPAATSRRCSGTASPWRSCPPEVEEGAAVAIDVRGEPVPARVVPTPFVAKG